MGMHKAGQHTAAGILVCLGEPDEGIRCLAVGKRGHVKLHERHVQIVPHSLGQTALAGSRRAGKQEYLRPLFLPAAAVQQILHITLHIFVDSLVLSEDHFLQGCLHLHAFRRDRGEIHFFLSRFRRFGPVFFLQLYPADISGQSLRVTQSRPGSQQLFHKRGDTFLLAQFGSGDVEG